MERASAVELKEKDWHALSTEDVARSLSVDLEVGLSDSEVSERLERYGRNELPREEGESALLRFLRQFHNVLIYVLLVASVFTAFLGEWIDTGVILAVVLVNAVVGFVQEGKAEEALENIRKMLALEAAVLRDGSRRTLSAEELVPGDVVLLESGDGVPADLRLFLTRNARAEEAALTGESTPVAKSTDPVAPETLLGDRKCMAYSGTVVTSGRIRGVVVATGRVTEIGRIGELVAGVQKVTTPLLEKISAFGKWLSVAILIFSAALFTFGALLRDYTVAELFLIVVSFVVAAIPEGLPAIMTITLALGVQHMAQRNAIVRNLPAVETLGSVTVICSDKTGTLTRNEMMVGRAVTADQEYEVTGSGYAVEGEIRVNGMRVTFEEHPVLEQLARTGYLCSDAELGEDEESGERVLQGDPTEGAVVVFAEKGGLDLKAVQEEHSRLDVIPFESENQFMATLNEGPDGGRAILVKGAPERILGMCGQERSETGDAELDPDRWQEVAERVAGEGFRILAVAIREDVPPDEELGLGSVENGFVFLGIVGLLDPPRPEVLEAVAACKRAGIRVKMITGDHALTAANIAAELAIGDGEHVVTGKELDETSDEELVELAQRCDVFARTSPDHKLRLVKALQEREEVVAMTGDGVNDAPALKRADIGVAMGIKGSEAAKNAAEMVLADDNFASIQNAVREGRTVYDNLRKTILFILPTNGAEALIVMSAVLFAFAELPITPVQILWVNMITAVTLALSLAFEPAEKGIMDRSPRPRDYPILSGYLLWRIAFVAAIVAAMSQLLFFRELAGGTEVEVARTVAVNVLVAGQLFYLFNSRFIMGPAFGVQRLLSNRAVLVAVAALICFQAVFTYAPPFQVWFGTAPLGGIHWLGVLGAGTLVFIAVEIEKAVVRTIKGLPRYGARAP